MLNSNLHLFYRVKGARTHTLTHTRSSKSVVCVMLVYNSSLKYLFVFNSLNEQFEHELFNELNLSCLQTTSSFDIRVRHYFSALQYSLRTISIL